VNIKKNIYSAYICTFFFINLQMEQFVQRSKQGMVERVSKIIQVKKLSASRFADILGVPRSTISHILSGRNNPSLEFIQKVLSSFPEVRVAWLMRGEEPMFISANTLFSDVEFDDPPPGRSKESNRPGVGSGSGTGNGGDSKDSEGFTEKNDSHRVRRSAQDGKPEEKPEAAPVSKIPSEKKANPSANTGTVEPGSLPGGSQHTASVPHGKRAVRVMFFYADGTFSEFVPG
jgi:transcriptional regulator with XRE-family HTH domain